MNVRPMISKSVLPLLASFFTAGCASNQEPLEPVSYVDIDRFMGDWYVIANIPTFVEKTAHNAVENYQRNDDGSIATTFTFRDDAFDGELKTYTPTGFIRDAESNAVWGMRFIWPIKADYRIVYLADDYSRTIIGRNKRDYVWLMSRTPEIPAEEYSRLGKMIADMGYDVSELRKVPQQW